LSLDTILAELEDPAQHVASTELGGLSNLTGADRERFLAVWRSLSIQRRRDLIDRLADLAEDNVDLDFSHVFLAGALDEDVQVRADSVKALWEYEGEDLIGLLLRLLHDAEAIVRAEAALGLGRFLLRAELLDQHGARSREVEEALREVVRDEEELPEVRGRAIEAVGVRSADWVQDIIEDAYDSGERRLRLSAVHAMGRNADLAWLPTIISEMESDDSEMRYEAAMAAGGLADEEAIPPLTQLALDEDAEVQEAAIAALGEIGGPAARDALNGLAAEQTDGRVQEAINDALMQAEFVEDPLGLRIPVDLGPDDDEEES
jgi:HEAT repeat protein